MEPKYTFEIKMLDGTSHRVAVGNKVVGEGSYYVLPQGETQPALVGSATLNTLIALPEQPPYAPPTPTATPATLEPLPTMPLTGTPSP